MVENIKYTNLMVLTTKLMAMINQQILYMNSMAATITAVKNVIMIGI